MNENIVFPLNPICDMDTHLRHYSEIKSKIKSEIKLKNKYKYESTKKRMLTKVVIFENEDQVRPMDEEQGGALKRRRRHSKI